VRRVLTMMLGLLSTVALAQVPPVYTQAVHLADELYLHEETLDATEMVRASARYLEQRIDWLMVDDLPDGVALSTGRGRELAEVHATTLDDLPAALVELEDAVRLPGMELGDLNLREAVLQGALSHLDRYTVVMSGESLDRFTTRIEGTLEGIGATLRRTDEGLKLVTVHPGTPAEDGGLQDGDVLVSIDGVSTVFMPVGEAVRRIRGPRGTPVRVGLTREGEPYERTLIRRQVVLPNVHREVLEDGVGYLSISHISKRTVENLRGQIAGLRADPSFRGGIVLDLRGNNGGSLLASAGTVDEFVTGGELVRTVGRDEQPVRGLREVVSARASGLVLNETTVVLVDHRTASGAEIIAGGLKELGRVVVVGERSFGKGVVQRIYPLDAARRLKMTVAEYLLPGRVPVVDQGVMPDVTIQPVQFGEHRVQFTGWDPEREQRSWEEMVPDVLLTGEEETLDVGLEIARRLVHEHPMSQRDVLLEAIPGVSAQVRALAEAHMVEAFAERGIQWEGATEQGSAPEVKVSLRVQRDRDEPTLHHLVAEVKNLGPTPLHQTLLRLHSDDYYGWDGAVIPVGLVPSGASVEADTVVPFKLGVGPRSDSVEVEVHADQRPPVRAGEHVLRAQTPAIPHLSVEARYVVGDPGHVEMRLHHHGGVPLDDVEVSIAYPSDEDILLLEGARWFAQLTEDEPLTHGFAVQVGDGHPGDVSVRLRVRASNLGTLGRWDLDLPADGQWQHAEVPRIRARRVGRDVAVGEWTIPLHVEDDARLRSVVVWHNDTKVAWFPDMERNELDERVRINVVPGSQHVVVWAEDEGGRRSREVFYVRGVVSKGDSK